MHDLEAGLKKNKIIIYEVHTHDIVVVQLI